jgi:hypothetical protein
MGRTLFSAPPRQFLPGYDRAVPPGHSCQATISRYATGANWLETPTLNPEGPHKDTKNTKVCSQKMDLLALYLKDCCLLGPLLSSIGDDGKPQNRLDPNLRVLCVFVVKLVLA